MTLRRDTCRACDAPALVKTSTFFGKYFRLCESCLGDFARLKENCERRGRHRKVLNQKIADLRSRKPRVW